MIRIFFIGFHFSTFLINSDIKAGNILVDSDGSIRLADFGVARVLEGCKKHTEAQTFVGTPCWMVPEVMNREIYDAKVGSIFVIPKIGGYLVTGYNCNGII